MNEGHTKEYCKHREANYRDSDDRLVQIEYYYEIYQIITNHTTQDCLHNLKNTKPKWCAVCEDPTHNIAECQHNDKWSEQN